MHHTVNSILEWVCDAMDHVEQQIQMPLACKEGDVASDTRNHLLNKHNSLINTPIQYTGAEIMAELFQEEKEDSHVTTDGLHPTLHGFH